MKHITIPEAQNAKACRPQETIASDVICDLIHVLAAIEFDNERRVEACEVADVQADLVPAPKLEAGQLTTAQAAPEDALGIRCSPSKVSNVSTHDVVEAGHSGAIQAGIQPERALVV